jgi:hypothetical protein
MADKSGRGTYAITVDPYEFKNLLGLLGSFPAEYQQLVRDRAQPLSAPAPQTKLVVQTIKTPRDRLVRVDIGGPKKVGRPYGGESSKSGKGKKVRQQAAPAGALLWGTEFGSHGGVDSIGRVFTNRFKTPYNKRGYWIAPAVDFYVPVVAREYSLMVQQIANELRLK